MGVKLRINPLAVSDMQSIKEYISEDNPQAARRVIAKILDKIDGLADFPEMGGRLSSIIGIRSNYRYLVQEDYMIFYTYESNIVSVYRVLHGKRDIGTLLFDQQQ